MEGGGTQYNPRTVEEVFRDFKGRRAGMIKALTTGFPLVSRENMEEKFCNVENL